MQTNQAKPIRIVVHVEGGVVQAVLSEAPIQMEIAVMDFDYSSEDDDIVVCGESRFSGHIDQPLCAIDKVAQIFDAIGQSLPEADQQEHRYVAARGQCCPVCQSQNLLPNEPQLDGADCCCDILCNDCHASWTDRYVLAGYSDLSLG